MAKKNEERFATILEEGSSILNVSRTLLVDRQTGVTYLLAGNGYGTGLTPLLDADGRPVITRL